MVIGFIMNEALPEGKKGSEAEELTKKIQKAINQEAWDSTAALSWTFMNLHSYIWDKERNLVQVTWNDNKVLYNTKTLQGIAFEDDEQLDDEETREAIETANTYFNNDSFWLIAPFKLNDPGTERSIVEIDGEQALKATYTSGGDTPGDSYLWLLNDDFTPKAWKLWVTIIPVGGVKMEWNNWKTFSTGAKLATEREGLFVMNMNNIHLTMNVKNLNGGKDPFEEIEF